MHWRIRSLQEQEHLGDEDRENVLRAAGVSSREFGMVFYAIILGATASLCLMTLVAPMMAALALHMQGTTFLLSWAFCIAAAYQVLMIRSRGQILFYLEKVAKSQRLPACLKCGYDLTGLTANRCPECGYSLAPVQSP